VAVRLGLHHRDELLLTPVDYHVSAQGLLAPSARPR